MSREPSAPPQLPVGRRRWLPVLLLPALVAVAVWVLSAKEMEYAVGGAVAVLILAGAWRRPVGVMVALVIFLPIEPLLFGLLLGLHVPASLLREASAFKELMVASLVVAALIHIRRTGRRLAAVDLIGLAYVGVVTIYLLVPHLFSPVAPTVWHARLLAWRADCAYVFVFLAARHAPISSRGRDLFYRAVMTMGALTAALALYQRARPAAWQHFLLGPAHQVQYLQTVLHQSAGEIHNVLRYPLVLNPLHVGSIFLSPYDMSDYLLLAAAVSLDRLTRDRRSIIDYVLLAGVITAIFFSRVRSDAVAFLILYVVVLLPDRRRSESGRLRLIALALVAAALIVPSLGGSRFVGAQGGSASSSAHVSEISRGIRLFEQHPLGIGLGAQPGTAMYLPGSNGQPTDLTTDNAITQTADELGVQALIPWLLFLIVVLVSLWRRSRQTGDRYSGAAFLALLGVLIAGQYHHVFLEEPVPWTLWAAVGLALPAGRAPRRPVPDEVSGLEPVPVP